MFGYVTANKPELKIREFARYKGYYCGLCHTLLENHGRRGQMTLTYDMTFLVILLSSLYEPKEEEMRKRCLIHPAKKQYMIQNEVSVYASDMNILLTYDHLKDDWDDERKISGFFGMKVFAAKKKKIEKKHKRQAEAIEKALKELAELEKENCQDIDAAARPFGSLMAELFVWKEDAFQEILRAFGFYLGKFIYILDAYDDLEEDIKKNHYNPFKSICNEQGFDDRIKGMLQMMMAECSKEFEYLPILENAEILRNILYAGVWTVYYKTLKARREQKKEND